MSTAASVALLFAMIPLRSASPSRKCLGIEHVRLCQCFLEPALEGFDRIGGTIGHRVLPEFVLRTETQPDGVDRDVPLPGVGDCLGEGTAGRLPIGDHNEPKLPVPELLVALLHQSVHPLFNRLGQGRVPAGSGLLMWLYSSGHTETRTLVPLERCGR